MTRPVGERRKVALGAAAIGVFAFALRLANLDHTPYVDEMNHVIAAASLLSDGAPLLVGDYEYTRAWLMTWMVAASYLVFGEGLVAARVPALLAGTALVVGVFAWVRRSVGPWEGWTAGVLVALAPEAIYHSQLARFYSFQALFVLGVAWAAWMLVRTTSVRRGALLLAFGALCAAGALHMQLSSIVGLGAVGLWFVGAVGLAAVGYAGGGLSGLREAATGPRSSRLLAVGGVIIAGGVALLWFHLSGNLERAIWAFGSAQGAWAEPQAANLRYYHNSMLLHYPLLWAPFPLIALVALVRRPGPASLWLLVFGTIFGAHTLAAWKADRYIFYALPFFFMAVALVVGPLLRWVWLEVAQGASRVVATWSGRGSEGADAPRWARVVTGAALVPVLLFAAWGNPALPYTARMIFGSDAGWPFEIKYRGEPDWAGVARDLGERVEEVEVVMSSTELKALYFLDRNDLILSVNYLGREPSGEMRAPFSRNWKSDTPMIARPETLEAVVACHASGLILVEDNHWGQGWSVPPEVVALIEERAERIELPPGRRVHAFGWEEDRAGALGGEGCDAVRRELGAG